MNKKVNAQKKSRENLILRTDILMALQLIVAVYLFFRYPLSIENLGLLALILLSIIGIKNLYTRQKNNIISLSSFQDVLSIALNAILILNIIAVIALALASVMSGVSPAISVPISLLFQFYLSIFTVNTLFGLVILVLAITYTHLKVKNIAT